MVNKPILPTTTSEDTQEVAMETLDDSESQTELKSKKKSGRRTWGQKVAQVKEAIQNSTPICGAPDLTVPDVPENQPYASDAEEGVFTGNADELELCESEPNSKLRGILWLQPTLSSLELFLLISFTEDQIQAAMTKAEQVLSTLQTSFFCQK